MIASVVAAFVASRQREDELEVLRSTTYRDVSPAAVDAPAAHRPAFDLDGLSRAAQGDPRLMRAIISDFLEQIPGLTQRVRTALDLGDAREIKQCAMAFRNAAGPLGADRFLKSVEQLEKAATSDITLAWRAADVFDRDLERLRQSLERTRGELDAVS